MRYTKFRAWQEDYKSWAYFSLAHLVSGDTSDVAEQCINWGEYTGLKDKSFNEVDVYEGDLFGKSNSDGVEVFGEVYFDTDFAGFCVKYPNGGWSTLGEHLIEKQNHREIIGNIYENPELVKENSND